MTQRSAVATLLAQISDEYDAAYRALYGLSSHSSQHRIISAHMERAGEVSEELSILIGKDAAAPYIVDTLNTAIDNASHAPIVDTVVAFVSITELLRRSYRPTRARRSIDSYSLTTPLLSISSICRDTRRVILIFHCNLNHFLTLPWHPLCYTACHQVLCLL
jgi:hypothetical protein